MIKSEPQSYCIDHLQKDGTTAWTGVRNFQARNYMQQMQIGDLVLFYHSSCKVPGVYGLAEVSSAPYPDPTQFDEQSHYYEPRTTKEKPIWHLVDISFVKKLPEPVSLTAIRANDGLHSMAILQPGSRLSVTPATIDQYEEILRMTA
jgi:predicted RNA-binding protein with PUA-like domain